MTPPKRRDESGLTNFSVMKPVEFDAPLLEKEPEVIMARQLEDYQQAGIAQRHFKTPNG